MTAKTLTPADVMLAIERLIGRKISKQAAWQIARRQSIASDALMALLAKLHEEEIPQ